MARFNGFTVCILRKGFAWCSVNTGGISGVEIRYAGSWKHPNVHYLIWCFSQISVNIALLLQTRTLLITSSMTAPNIGPQAISDEVAREKLAAFDKVPLFMKSLPEEDSEDPLISALQTLAHEGTPDGG